MSLKKDRERLQVAIQACSPEEVKPDLIGALCTGWVVVAEFMNTTGHKWLTRIDDEDSTIWGRQGLLHNALHGEWEEDE